MTIIIFVIGGPGSGKSTQCKNIARKYGFHHVALGDLLRQAGSEATSRGRQIDDIMKKGLLLPTGAILDILNEDMLSQPEIRGFLVDGFPRALEQAKEFEQTDSRLPDAVIALDCETETLIHRLLLRGQSGARADDSQSLLWQRLETHYSMHEAVLAFYLQKRLLFNVSGEESPEKVFAQCCSIIDHL
ncbi:adenylate kinase isoenzyme 1-like isoform X2 [Tachyglossus aculeatus]|nr:adenylate kinase isoenzyme 1-like isoform X2 [Tachyglossus aculeatus]